MSKSCLWGKFLAVIVCVFGVLPPRANGAEGVVQREIAEAIRLYEDLEYELALERLKRASSLSHDASEAVSMALLRGIILADMGRWDAARKDFQDALQRQLDVQLPLSVSPKVSREFEAQREKLRGTLADGRQDSPVGGVGASDARLVEGTRPALMPSSTGTSSPAPWAPGSVDGAMGKTSEGVQIAGRRVPLASWVLLGVGVAAGGTGTVFGLSSKSQLEDARSAVFDEDMEAFHSRAQGSARTANILFGAATAAAVGAVATWFFSGSGDAPVADGGMP
ncbi:tetratricopeptide repeat protein [Myxococcus landrumensis]|uniref:Tetratricopeptide repeat protein n=1 Tax=Myxococcus landrumensis TaxID=2813577 RepID=A0ABX7MZH9_9BACT|nr:tetratricopeptide repeat protein [Myxococcus landrumus]QSQ11850.1 tetratricopeptide repeat protein [Myxococcus landrumus]